MHSILYYISVIFSIGPGMVTGNSNQDIEDVLCTKILNKTHGDNCVPNQEYNKE
jgi:hypothetical protein